jgi:hypothetical protein
MGKFKRWSGDKMFWRYVRRGRYKPHVRKVFICGAKDVRLFEIRSNMKQRRKWFEAFETFCGKQIYGDNDKHNLLICICNIKDYKNYGLLRNL